MPDKGSADEWLWCVDGAGAVFRLTMVAACFAFAGLDYWSWILPVLVLLSGAWWHGARGGDLFETGQCMLSSFLLAICAYGMVDILVHLEESASVDFWPEADLAASGVLACSLTAGILSVWLPQRYWLAMAPMALACCRAVTGMATVTLAGAVVVSAVFALAVDVPSASVPEVLFAVFPAAFASFRVLGCAAADGFVLARCGVLWCREAPPGTAAPRCPQS